MESPRKARIAILGSGAGSNAQALCLAARQSTSAYRVAVIVATSPNAGICGVARSEGVDLVILEQATETKALAKALELIVDSNSIDVLVLAGFMRLLPPETINLLHGRVLNIHPALLPEFGGKGMYGIHVHEAVVASGSAVTGATVHLVTEHYDEGAILGQGRIDVLPGESAIELQSRVKTLEHSLYPVALDQFARTINDKNADLAHVP